MPLTIECYNDVKCNTTVLSNFYVVFKKKYVVNDLDNITKYYETEHVKYLRQITDRVDFNTDVFYTLPLLDFILFINTNPQYANSMYYNTTALNPLCESIRFAEIIEYKTEQLCQRILNNQHNVNNFVITYKKVGSSFGVEKLDLNNKRFWTVPGKCIFNINQSGNNPKLSYWDKTVKMPPAICKGIRYKVYMMTYTVPIADSGPEENNLRDILINVLKDYSIVSTTKDPITKNTVAIQGFVDSTNNLYTDITVTMLLITNADNIYQIIMDSELVHARIIHTYELFDIVFNKEDTYTIYKDDVLCQSIPNLDAINIPVA